MPPIRSGGRKGALLPGTHFVGPWNEVDFAPARSQTDEAAKSHDIQYGNPAVDTDVSDQQLIDSVDNSWKGNLVGGLIGLKKNFDKVSEGIYTDTLVRGAGHKGGTSEPKEPMSGGKRTYPKPHVGQGKQFKYNYQGGDIDFEAMDADQSPPEMAAGGPQAGGNLQGAVGGGGSGNPNKAGSLGGKAHLKRSMEPEIRRKTFARTFTHYMQNTTSGKISSTYDTVTKRHVVTWSPAIGDIPYTNPRMAMTNLNGNEIMMKAKAFRIAKCGYKISDIIPMNDELSTGGATPQSFTTFNTAGFMFHYVDEDGMIFPQEAKTNSGDLPNLQGLHNLPASRAEGLLRPKSWTFRGVPDKLLGDCGYTSGAAIADAKDDNFQSILNGAGWETVRAGDDCGFEWETGMPMMNAASSTYLDNAIHGRANLHAQGDSTGYEDDYPQINFNEVPVAPTTFGEDMKDKFENKDGIVTDQTRKGLRQFWSVGDTVARQCAKFAPEALLMPCVTFAGTGGAQTPFIWAFNCTYFVDVEWEDLYDGCQFGSALAFANAGTKDEYVYKLNHHPAKYHKWTTYGGHQ